MKTDIIAAATRQLPVPSRLLHPALQLFGDRLKYPTEPRVFRSRHGFKIEIRDYTEHIQSYIYWLGRFEPRESTAVKKILRPGDSVIDAGANIGWFSLLASSIIGASGKIFAFEPFGATADHLARNLSLNALSNVEVHRVALSDTHGKAKLAMKEIGNSGTASLFVGDADKGEVVETARLDDILPDRRFKLLKMDVEGAEPMLLRGAKKLLRNGRIETILFEINEGALRRGGSSSAELVSLVKSFGYRIAGVGLFRAQMFNVSAREGQSINVIATLPSLY